MYFCGRTGQHKLTGGTFANVVRTGKHPQRQRRSARKPFRNIHQCWQKFCSWSRHPQGAPVNRPRWSTDHEGIFAEAAASPAADDDDDEVRFGGAQFIRPRCWCYRHPAIIRAQALTERLMTRTSHQVQNLCTVRRQQRLPVGLPENPMDEAGKKSDPSVSLEAERWNGSSPSGGAFLGPNIPPNLRRDGMPV